MEVQCRYLRPLAVAFVRETGPYATSSRAAWQRMFAWLDEVGARAGVRRGIGYIRDNPAEVGPFLRRYDACVELPAGVRPSPAHGIGRMMLPGGAYAVYRHSGSHDGLPRTFSLLHRKWLADQGFVIDRDRAFMESGYPLN
jgi:AraC family transcriptional regulator